MSPDRNAQSLKMTREAILHADEQDRMLYGTLVSGLRRSRKMTQESLAEAAGISRRTVVSVERGQGTPQGEKLVAIFGALDVLVDIDEFADVRQHLLLLAPLLRAIDPDFRTDVVAKLIGVLSHEVLAHPNPNPVSPA